jgi:lipopolysaccharide export system protein LptC
MRMPAVLSAGVCLGLALGCRPIGPKETRDVVPVLELHGVRFKVYRGDRLTATGEARTATLRRETGEVTAHDLDALLLGADAVPARVAAPEGSGDLDDRTFAVTGGVTATSGTDVARTDRARYEPIDRLVHGEDPVVVTGRGYRLDGTGFVLDPATSELTILSNARLLAGTEGH